MTETDHSNAARSAKRSRLILLALFALFFAPIFTAWWMIGQERYATPHQTTNSGMFVEPTGRFGIEGLDWLDRTPLADAQSDPWTVVVYVGKACTKPCMDTLYKVRQAHLALGKDQARVARLVVLDERVDGRSIESVQKAFPGFSRARAPLPWAQALDSARPPREGVFLADPNGVVFMHYRLDFDPKGLIKDLKRVLKISKIG